MYLASMKGSFTATWSGGKRGQHAPVRAASGAGEMKCEAAIQDGPLTGNDLDVVASQAYAHDEAANAAEPVDADLDGITGLLVGSCNSSPPRFRNSVRDQPNTSECASCVLGSRGRGVAGRESMPHSPLSTGSAMMALTAVAARRAESLTGRDRRVHGGGCKGGLGGQPDSSVCDPLALDISEIKPNGNGVYEGAESTSDAAGGAAKQTRFGETSYAARQP